MLEFKHEIDNKEFSDNISIEERLDKLELKMNSILENIPSINGMEFFSESRKEEIGRELRVRQINASANNEMKKVYQGEKRWRESIALNEEDNTPLSAKELKEIDDFWKPYLFAYENNPECQRINSRISGRFDPSYISWELQYYILKPFWETKVFRMMTYKNLIALLFQNIPMPQTYVLCGWGLYLDKENNQVSKEEAAEIVFRALENGEKLLIKPSDGVCGSGIRTIEATSKQEIMHIFDEYKDNFLCQELIENHSSYNASKALSTLRIVTFYYKGEFYWVGTMLRMGMTSDIVDNWHHGGISCPVSEEGICGSYAVALDGKKYYEHPSGFQFAGRKLYHYEKAHALSLKLHKKLPFVKYIAWDIAIDKAGEAKVLEFGNPGDSAIMQAGGYNVYLNKETIKEILDEYLIRRFFYYKATMDWDYHEYKDYINLVKYGGVGGCVRVPEYINGKKVKCIFAGAIAHPKIQEVYVPTDVRLEKGSISSPNAKIIRI